MKKKLSLLLIIILSLVIVLVMVVVNKNLEQDPELRKIDNEKNQTMRQLLQANKNEVNALKDGQSQLDFLLEKNKAQKMTYQKIAQITLDFINTRKLADSSYDLGCFCTDEQCLNCSESVSIPRLSPYILWGKYQYYKANKKLDFLETEIANIHYAHIIPQPHADFNCTLLYDIYLDEKISQTSKETLRQMCQETQWEVADISNLYDSKFYDNFIATDEALKKEVQRNMRLIKEERWPELVAYYPHDLEIFNQWLTEDKENSLVPFIHLKRYLHFISELITVRKWQIKEPIMNSFPSAVHNMDPLKISQLFFNKVLINYAIINNQAEELKWESNYFNYSTSLALASFYLYQENQEKEYLDFALDLEAKVQSFTSATSYLDYGYLLSKLRFFDPKNALNYQQKLNKLRDYLIIQKFDYPQYPANLDLNLSGQKAFFDYKNQYKTQLNAYILGILSL